MASKLSEYLRARGAEALIVVVQFMNWLAVSLGAIVVAVNAMYPQLVSEFASHFSPALKMVLLILWAGIVHYFTRQAKKTV